MKVHSRYVEQNETVICENLDRNETKVQESWKVLKVQHKTNEVEGAEVMHDS